MTTLTKSFCLLTLAAGLTGCATNNENEGTIEAQQVRNTCDAQAASGARADATLHPCHFDGANLNSLGTARLDDILADDDTAKPLTIYLDMPAGDTNESVHRDAIARYVETKGFAAADLKFEQGPNPATLHPAAERAAQLLKLNNPTAAPATGDYGPGNVGPTDASTATSGMK
jgi:hypothetical protein